MQTLYWDFHGPAAEQTAKHFAKHLNEFLARSGCSAATTGLSSAGPGHQAVWCRAPEPDAADIGRALRPRRVEADD